MDSFITWMGGKKLLHKEITAMFPTGISRYIEVFGGAAWVLFHKDRHADLEVYNDADGQLVNLFRCTKHHAGELQRELQWMLNSREFFVDFKAQMNMRGLTDIQRAARFFLLIKTSYGADRRSYGCMKRDIHVAIEYLEAIRKRLSKLVIENKDFRDIIKTYDREKALFYLDPPYYGSESYYDVKFGQQEHQDLLACLAAINGRFLLSYNDCEYIREMYKGFNIKEVSRQNNLTSGSFKELIVSNF